MRDRWIGISLVATALLLAGAAVAWNSGVQGGRLLRYAIIGVVALLGALLLPIVLKKLFGKRLGGRIGSSVILLRLIATLIVVLGFGMYALVEWLLKG